MRCETDVINFFISASSKWCLSHIDEDVRSFRKKNVLSLNNVLPHLIISFMEIMEMIDKRIPSKSDETVGNLF